MCRKKGCSWQTLLKMLINKYMWRRDEGGKQKSLINYIVVDKTEKGVGYQGNENNIQRFRSLYCFS